MFWLVEATAGGAPAPATSPVLYILAAVIAGGAMEIGWRAYRRFKHGGTEDALEMATAAQEAARSSRDLFTQYRVELEDAKGQLNQYLEQLVQVNRELGSAMARIVKLEEELTSTRGDNQRLREDLAEAKARRDELIARVAELQSRISQLETM